MQYRFSKTTAIGYFSFGDPDENRTRVTAVKGRSFLTQILNYPFIRNKPTPQTATPASCFSEIDSL